MVTRVTSSLTALAVGDFLFIMKKLKNTKPKLSVPVLLISAVLVFAYFWFIDGDKTHIIIAAFLEPVAVIFALFTMKLEKRADKKADSEHKGLSDGSHFSSVQWRQEYYDYTQKHGWDCIKKKRMIPDMCIRCHDGNSRALMLMGAFFFVSGTALIFSPEPLYTALFCIVFGGTLLYKAISGYFGFSVRRWGKSLGDESEAVENSYMNGHLLVFEENSLNIGKDYVIVLQKRNVSYCRLCDIVNVKRHIVRLKKYQNSTYAGEIYQHYAEISLADGRILRCRLNEFQVGMALQKIRSLINIPSEKDSSIEERFENQIITP